ncbi:hypothetical protein D3C77_466150 [compost metagenome]
MILCFNHLCKHGKTLQNGEGTLFAVAMHRIQANRFSDTIIHIMCKAVRKAACRYQMDVLSTKKEVEDNERGSAKVIVPNDGGAEASFASSSGIVF